MKPLFNKILVANRSEIAVRVMNACRVLSIPTVAVYSDADKRSKHTLYADEAIHIGASPPRESYLDPDKIINAAKETGCDAIHPGYGFLAENPIFAERCANEKIVFIGPSPQAIKLLGNKVESRAKMAEVGIPLIPGMQSADDDPETFRRAADETGYPVIIKAAAGGGGKGMRIVRRPAELTEAIEASRREARNAFDDESVYLEKYIINPRHIEFQVLADHHGNTVHLFERECSIQRRHQKIVEETPSLALTDELRAKMGGDAIKVAKAAGYTNAGTVEFLLDESGRYYFLEMNTRIQVEHPVTEMTTGIDLVVEQIRIAAGEKLDPQFFDLHQCGHAIECRIYAEDGDADFMPSIGTLLYYSEPAGPGVRVDSGVCEGSEITIDYDPIMAKLIVHAPNRPMAISKMIDALNNFKLLGVKTSKRFMVDVLDHPEFVAGNTCTDFIEKHMANRQLHHGEYEHIAIALASAWAASSGIQTSYEGKSAASSTPWNSLGDWEIGGRIGE